MFENIIGQASIVERLKREFHAGVLPSSLLLCGRVYTGKMSVALEIARALTCELGRAEWNCNCSACRSQRLLAHPDTLLLGPRYFSTEIAAAADVLLRVRKPPAQYLYVRALRKLLHRFDPVLWDGTESKWSSVRTHLEEINDRLSDLFPGRPLPKESDLRKTLQTINDRCAKVAGAVTDNIPVNQIRKTIFWAHTTGRSRAKVVIVESAERMLDASRNALLKILEEPPNGVYLILTTTRRGAIIPTIQSRLRPYFLSPRSPDASREVLSKIFREENPEYHDLRDYFLAWNDTDIRSLKRGTEQFLDGVLAPQGNGRLDTELLSFLSGPRVFRVFLEELSTACGRILAGRDPEGRRIDVDRLEVFSEYIRLCVLRSEQYNQSSSLLVECLYYNMRRTGGRL